MYLLVVTYFFVTLGAPTTPTQRQVPGPSMTTEKIAVYPTDAACQASAAALKMTVQGNGFLQGTVYASLPACIAVPSKDAVVG